MITRKLKLNLTRSQEREMKRWLLHLAAVWNWAIRKIENDARDHVYYSRMSFQNLLAGHGFKLGISGHSLQGVLADSYRAWERCFLKKAKKPRLKGRRNRLNSIAFPDPILAPVANRIMVSGIGRVRFYKQKLPGGKIKCGRVIRRASGWYLLLWIDAVPSAVQVTASNRVGIDPGFRDLLTLSSGEKVAHPKEKAASALRLTQAQHGFNSKLTARIQEHIANQRTDRNHKISRRLAAENAFIAFSKDSLSKMARRFGKSVESASHSQLRSMIKYKVKCRSDGPGIYIEPSSRNSTRTCSACGALTGPQGLAGLSVRQWDCSACGAHHDRDINAAVNTLIAGVGLTHETLATAA